MIKKNLHNDFLLSLCRFMKNILTLLLLVFSTIVSGQEETSSKANTFDVNYTYGVIWNHNPNILHLITGHPEGVLLSWNRKTFGKKEWEQRFNYPDIGVSFNYHNLKNKNLGDTYSLYTHYNFYFLKRNLMLRTGIGVSLASNPYDHETNNRNVAFGSRLLNSTYLMLNYKKESLFNTPFGIQAGFGITHYSNGNYKSPNTSVNVISANIGLSYNLNYQKIHTYLHTELDSKSFKESFAYNVALSGGINQGDVIGIKQFPFYVVAAYADKRIGRFSGFQLGAEIFLSKFLKEEIKYNAVAYPNRNIDPDTDYKRVGVFVGHELWVNKMTFITQVGYYVYYPYSFEKRIYGRLGFKRYFGKRYFGMINLKVHGAAAEAIEFGIGIRLKSNKK